MEASPILAWTFVSECPIPDDLGQILVEGEKPWAAYKTFRDSAVFTNKRLIVQTRRGSPARRWRSTRSPTQQSTCGLKRTRVGCSDFNAELELWTRAGHIKVKLNKGVDVRKLDNLISHAVLNGN